MSHLTWRTYVTGLLVVVAALSCREWTNLWTTAVAVGLCAVFLRQLHVASIRSERDGPRCRLEHSMPSDRPHAA